MGGKGAFRGEGVAAEVEFYLSEEILDEDLQTSGGKEILRQRLADCYSAKVHQSSWPGIHLLDGAVRPSKLHALHRY